MLSFLKLGGSLITHKDRPHTARRQILARLATEISLARQQDPELRILIGHGSGSFGHVAGKKYNTRFGVGSPRQWMGFAEVWRQAREVRKLRKNPTRLFGDENPQYGTKWITDGKENKKLKIGEVIQDGWKFGRIR